MIISHYLDASILVKYVCDEPRSKEVRDFYSQKSCFHTTEYCLYEALNILKSKWKYKGQLNHEDYLGSCEELLRTIEDENIGLEKINLYTVNTLKKSEELSKKYQIDLSDTLQIVSVIQGYISKHISKDTIMIVTADKDLADATKNEGLLSWDVMNENYPK